MPVADWYHCSVKTVSRSAGRSVVAAAAYRLGTQLYDERYMQMRDYTRRRGVEAAFTVAPEDAPQWAIEPQALWNEAEKAEKRINSTVGREIELALPSFLSPKERRTIVEQLAAELVERYHVAVSVALHTPGKGDDRNYHAHILFTTRELGPDGFGKKTRILDDQKTGRAEVTKLRQLAADIINERLAAAHSDIRVDPRSFKERGVTREATTHLGPAASEMERRGEPSELGELNREIDRRNHEREEQGRELATLDKAIEREQERISSPPSDPQDALERLGYDAAACVRDFAKQESQPGRGTPDGLTWWQRSLLTITRNARAFLQTLSNRAAVLWHEQNRDRQRRGRSQPKSWIHQAYRRTERSFDR